MLIGGKQRLAGWNNTETGFQQVRYLWCTQSDWLKF